jgi:hypothetical protein
MPKPQPAPKPLITCPTRNTKGLRNPTSPIVRSFLASPHLTCARILCTIFFVSLGTPGSFSSLHLSVSHAGKTGDDGWRSSTRGGTGIWCTWPKELDTRKDRDLMLMTQFQALQNDPTIVFGCYHHLHQEFLLLCFNSSHFCIPRKKSLFQGIYLPTLVAASLWNEDHRYRCDQARKGGFHHTCEKKVTLVASDTRME